MNNLPGYSSLNQYDDDDLDEDLQMFIKGSFKDDDANSSMGITQGSNDGLAQMIKEDKMAERFQR